MASRGNPPRQCCCGCMDMGIRNEHSTKGGKGCCRGVGKTFPAQLDGRSQSCDGRALSSGKVQCTMSTVQPRCLQEQRCCLHLPDALRTLLYPHNTHQCSPCPNIPGAAYRKSGCRATGDGCWVTKLLFPIFSVWQGNTGAQEGPGPCKKHAKAPGNAVSTMKSRGRSTCKPCSVTQHQIICQTLVVSDPPSRTLQSQFAFGRSLLCSSLSDSLLAGV